MVVKASSSALFEGGRAAARDRRCREVPPTPPVSTRSRSSRDRRRSAKSAADRSADGMPPATALPRVTMSGSRPTPSAAPGRDSVWVSSMMRRSGSRVSDARRRGSVVGQDDAMLVRAGSMSTTPRRVGQLGLEASRSLNSATRLLSVTRRCPDVARRGTGPDGDVTIRDSSTLPSVAPRVHQHLGDPSAPGTGEAPSGWRRWRSGEAPRADPEAPGQLGGHRSGRLVGIIAVAPPSSP